MRTLASLSFKVLINGSAYARAGIRAQLMGQTVAGIMAISYGHKQEKVSNYGADTNPVGRGLIRTILFEGVAQAL